MTYKTVDIELTCKAYEMPRTASISQPHKPTKKQAYFSSFLENDDAKDGSDSLLREVDHVKELLEESNIRIPKTDENDDSYQNVRRLIFGSAIKYNLAKIEKKYLSFSEVVDIDAKEGIETHIKEGLATRFGEGNFFRIFIFALIIANSIVIGLETDPFLESRGVVLFAIIDYVFLAFFTAEIFLKNYYGFIEFWSSHWNWYMLSFIARFDAFIVAAALAGPGVHFLANSRTLRILRVLRTLRSLRSVSFFQGLDMIMETIFESLPDLFYIAMLILMAMFIWGAAGIVLFSELLPDFFGNIGYGNATSSYHNTALFTLYVVISGDGWVAVHEQLSTLGYFLPSAIYFASFLIFGGFILQQLVVAVVVANLKEKLDKSDREKHESKKKLGTDLKSTRGQKRFQKPVVPPPPSDEPVPYEVPDFDNFTVARFDRYLLVLSILEANLAEFQKLKQAVGDACAEVTELNRGDGEEYEEGYAESDFSESDDEYDESDDDGGDALSAFHLMLKNSRRDSLNVSRILG